MVGRGSYYQTADAFLIQVAVREFITAALGRRLIVWGGQPAITPMVWAACEDLGVDYSNAVVLYQSEFFADRFPDETSRFQNVVFVPEVSGSRDLSLQKMLETMLGRGDLDAAVFIGGMEGILDEYQMFSALHQNAAVLAVASPGGAALDLAKTIGVSDQVALRDVDFARLFHAGLGIKPSDPRISFI